MLFSAFAPFGQLDFSSDESEGEKVYKSMVAGFTDPRDGRTAIDLTADETNYQEAKIFATAMAIAAARVTLRHAHAQLRPETSFELLEAHERRYGIVPGPQDTVTRRRGLLDARQKVSRGPRRDVIDAGLRAILGANLIRYRTISASEASKWPTSPGSGPGVFARVDVVPRIVRALAPIAGVYGAHDAGDPNRFQVTVPYENWLAREPDVHLQQGDVVCVGAENLGLAEKVTIDAVSGDGATRTFTARFYNPHDEGCSVTTGPMPLWTSTKRFVLIVVKAAASVDADVVRRIDDFMGTISRAVTQWAIVQPTTPGATTVGPFTLGSSPLGAVTIGTVTI